MNLAEQLDAATASYVSGDPLVAKRELDAIIEAYPNSFEASCARYFRGRGKADGLFDGVPDDIAAVADLEIARQEGGSFGALCNCAIVRVLYDRGSQAGKTDEMVRLCDEALELDPIPQVMMMRGLVAEHRQGDHRLARRWYWSAARRGLVWGIRYAAYSHISQRNYLRGAVVHTLATILAPVFFVFVGRKSPFP